MLVYGCDETGNERSHEVADTEIRTVDGKTRPNSGRSPGWVVAFRETFDNVSIDNPSWQRDTYPDDGPFSDDGAYFEDQAIKLPTAYRATQPFGTQDWLTIESYSRDEATRFGDLVTVVDDPAGGTNKVLKITSPAHTDATVIRPTRALPARYRVSLRVGYADFGTGKGRNGYQGNECAGPWIDGQAKTDNGFYWLAILDQSPRPHNNIWIHHHRKVVIDSDNHLEPWWTEIWNGNEFVESGVHPVMMFVLDGLSEGTVRTGKPFIALSDGKWQHQAHLDAIRAADAYKANTWYRVSIERSNGKFIIEASGDFEYGGQQTYRKSIDYAANCVWHYNRTPEEVDERCLDQGTWPGLSGFLKWPAGEGWPDYFMFGDPHANFYEGHVYYDDVTLEVWQ
jgi:hypothetical protein